MGQEGVGERRAGAAVRIVHSHKQSEITQSEPVAQMASLPKQAHY